MRLMKTASLASALVLVAVTLAHTAAPASAHPLCPFPPAVSASEAGFTVQAWTGSTNCRGAHVGTPRDACGNLAVHSYEHPVLVHAGPSDDAGAHCDYYVIVYPSL